MSHTGEIPEGKRRPQTDEEWQDATDVAYGLLVLDAAVKFGFVTGGPRIRIERCEAFLEEAEARGVRPRPDALKRFTAGLAEADLI